MPAFMRAAAKASVPWARASVADSMAAASVLLAAMPRLHARAERLPDIPGQLLSPADPPPGCRFAPRCPLARAVCSRRTPQLRCVEAGHEAACWDGIWEEAERADVGDQMSEVGMEGTK